MTKRLNQTLVFLMEEIDDIEKEDRVIDLESLYSVAKGVAKRVNHEAIMRFKIFINNKQ